MQGGHDQVARQCRLDRNFCGFAIAHFPDHDHIRILAEKGSQHLRKGQPDLGLDLHLVEPLQPVLHRIFHRQNLEVLALQFLHGGIQRGGLPGACGTCHQKDPMWHAEQLTHGFQSGWREVQALQREQVEVLFQQAHDDRFAKHGGNGGHARVHFLAMHAQLGAPVLRHPAFRNVQLRKDLDAGHHSGGILVINLVNGVQLAVHPYPDHRFFFVGFDVNVGGLGRHGLGEDMAHALDDGGLRGHVPQVLDEFRSLKLVRNGFSFRLRLLDVPGIELTGYFRLQAKNDPGHIPKDQAQCIAQCRALRIYRREIRRGLSVLCISQRKQVVGQQKAGVQPRSFRLFLRESVLAHQRQSGLPGQCGVDIHLRHQPQTDQQAPQTTAHGTLDL
ncbi:hypothetical protein D3C71_856580 [compost metagenome]